MAQSENNSEYLVLARKYRPQSFSDLIGQDMLVQTLKNALEKGRLAHAFVLTGVRGVGKTTTARIIAKGLNCIGADGKGDPTLEPCGVCENCLTIIKDRHIDVIEMDAASRTGVDNVREIIESVKYQPVSARYKIYIIDEVHMLSTAAFNALLKTLEEPPAHVKFIFATTEIRKVPVTVLSRCQRFDLRRVKPEELTAHFQNICTKENIKADDEALKILARGADGSVRDGLSLLDQAISLSDGHITEAIVEEMLGLSDRSKSLDLLEAILEGNSEKSLGLFQDIYISGTEPIVIIEDLMQATHWLSRLKMVPEAINKEESGGLDYGRSQEIAQKISVSLTNRLWQMLLKGLEEAKYAPSSLMAAEMLILRLITASSLPSPEEAAEIVKRLTASEGLAQKKNQLENKTQPALKSAPPLTPLRPDERAQTLSAPPSTEPEPSPPQPQQQATRKPLKEKLQPQAKPQETILPLDNLENVIAYLKQKKEIGLATELSHDWAMADFQKNHITLSSLNHGKSDFPRRLAQYLQMQTGEPWRVELSYGEEKGKSFSQIKRDENAALKEEWQQSPLMQNIQKLFPEAVLVEASELEMASLKPMEDEMPLPSAEEDEE